MTHASVRRRPDGELINRSERALGQPSHSWPRVTKETTMQNGLKLSRKDTARVKHLLQQPRPYLLCSTFLLAKGDA
jgi:hypothetical protein